MRDFDYERYNEVTNLRLRCHSVKHTAKRGYILNCSILTKKKADGTYPAPVWISVVCPKNGSQFERFDHEVIGVTGTIKADSWIDQHGVEIPQLTVFADYISLFYKKG